MQNWRIGELDNIKKTITCKSLLILKKAMPCMLRDIWKIRIRDSMFNPSFSSWTRGSIMS